MASRSPWRSSRSGELAWAHGAVDASVRGDVPLELTRLQRGAQLLVTAAEDLDESGRGKRATLMVVRSPLPMRVHRRVEAARATARSSNPMGYWVLFACSSCSAASESNSFAIDSLCSEIFLQ